MNTFDKRRKDIDKVLDQADYDELSFIWFLVRRRNELKEFFRLFNLFSSKLDWD